MSYKASIKTYVCVHLKVITVRLLIVYSLPSRKVFAANDQDDDQDDHNHSSNTQADNQA